MVDDFRLAVAVLAAGQSRRFGEQDKLRAIFRGKPVGLHVTDTLSRIAADMRVVVTSSLDHVCKQGWETAGFSVVKNPSADEGMGTSVAVAARLARRAGADALLIALADMPLVTREHYLALIENGQKGGAQAVFASSNGQVNMPPALFGCDHFDALCELSGDQGARALLRDAQAIDCPPEWLVDIDTPEALAALG